jgi:small GTP-binding protein
VKPVIALVGRPNVGKSTLFNRLTRRRDAIVIDVPGATRDRHYGEGRLGERPFFAVDTGGIEPDAKEGIFVHMARRPSRRSSSPTQSSSLPMRAPGSRRQTARSRIACGGCR